MGIPAHGVTGYKDVKVDDEQSLMDAVSKQPVSVAIEAHDSDRYVLRKSMIGCCFPVIFEHDSANFACVRSEKNPVIPGSGLN